MVFCQKNKRYGPVFSSSLFRGIYFIESLRSKILPNIKKKSRRKILKIRKVGGTFWKNFEIFEIFDIFENFQNFRKFCIGLPIEKIENFENFRKFQKSQNFSKFSIFLRKFFRKYLQLFEFSKFFVEIFFWDEVKISCGAIQ